MNFEEIRSLVARGESETLEFKTTTGGRREAARTVCAMLNLRGGHVLFGVTPDGQVVGRSVSGRTAERVADEIRRIDPPAFPSINLTPVEREREWFGVRILRESSHSFYAIVAFMDAQ